MPAPKVAVIGSADPSRNNAEAGQWFYDPSVDVETARKMANALGAELARRGCRLVVYDGDNKFIEGEAVAGFVATAPESQNAIVVRQPQTRTPRIFPQEVTHPAVFERRVDTSEQWEVSFYRSIADTDGVILIGGGYSTIVAGQVAIGARIPIASLEKSGGAASKVWQSLLPGTDLPTLDEHARMAHPFSKMAIELWVSGLLDQRSRRYHVETREIRSHALLAIVMFIVALGLAFVGHLWRRSPGLWALLASTLLGGGAGAAIRMVYERRYGSGPLVPPAITVTLGLGMISGGLAGLLYLVAQPGMINLANDDALRLISIVVVVSVVGGLTAETVFRKLLGIDVIQTRGLTVPAGSVTKPQ